MIRIVQRHSGLPYEEAAEEMMQDMPDEMVSHYLGPNSKAYLWKASGWTTTPVKPVSTYQFFLQILVLVLYGIFPLQIIEYTDTCRVMVTAIDDEEGSVCTLTVDITVCHS